MAERPEDLNLPAAVISRLMKEALPDNCNVSKEARQAVCRAASVFVLYLTSQANSLAQQSKRKTLSAPDVLSALSEMELEEFVDPLKEALEDHRQRLKDKKGLKARGKPAEAAESADAEKEADHVEAVEEPVDT